MDLSHNRSCINSDVDGRLRRIFASKNRQVNHRFPVLSSVLGGKTQSWTGNAVELLEDFDMFTHFLAVTRHLRFEDIQTMVDLISDAVQISGLSSDLILHHDLGVCTYDLGRYLVPLLDPSESLDPCIQGVLAQAIRRCNEASTLPCNEVFLDGFPVYIQLLTHLASLYTPSCTMQALFDSLNPSFKGLPPQPFGSMPKGEGEAMGIRIMTTNQRSNQ